MSEMANKCKENIMLLASQKGFLTFDDIIRIANENSLSSIELDEVTNHVIMRGVIIYEESPDINESENNEQADYSRVDYEAIYKEIEELCPELSGIINEAKKAPTPQIGETKILIRQSLTGNNFARERVILMYLRNVLKIALSMTKSMDLQIEDAVFSGIAGLIVGIDRFDPDGFSVFHSYISMYIQQAIQRECEPIWMEYYFPNHIREKIISIYQEYDYLSEEPSVFDREKFLIVMSEKMDITFEKTEEYLAMILLQVEGKNSLEKLYEDELFDIPEKSLDDESDVFLQNYIYIMLNNLKANERDILMKRNGLGNNFKPMTLEEVGEVYGVTRERIRQIESKAKKKCNIKKYRDMLEGYL